MTIMQNAFVFDNNYKITGVIVSCKGVSWSSLGLWYTFGPDVLRIREGELLYVEHDGYYSLADKAVYRDNGTVSWDNGKIWFDEYINGYRGGDVTCGIACDVCGGIHEAPVIASDGHKFIVYTEDKDGNRVEFDSCSYPVKIQYPNNIPVAGWTKAIVIGSPRMMVHNKLYVYIGLTNGTVYLGSESHDIGVRYFQAVGKDSTDILSIFDINKVHQDINGYVLVSEIIAIPGDALGGPVDKDNNIINDIKILPVAYHLRSPIVYNNTLIEVDRNIINIGDPIIRSKSPTPGDTILYDKHNCGVLMPHSVPTQGGPSILPGLSYVHQDLDIQQTNGICIEITKCRSDLDCGDCYYSWYRYNYDYTLIRADYTNITDIEDSEYTDTLYIPQAIANYGIHYISSKLDMSEYGLFGLFFHPDAVPLAFPAGLEYIYTDMSVDYDQDACLDDDGCWTDTAERGPEAYTYTKEMVGACIMSDINTDRGAGARVICQSIPPVHINDNYIAKLAQTYRINCAQGPFSDITGTVTTISTTCSSKRSESTHDQSDMTAVDVYDELGAIDIDNYSTVMVCQPGNKLTDWSKLDNTYYIGISGMSMPVYCIHMDLYVHNYYGIHIAWLGGIVTSFECSLHVTNVCTNPHNSDDMELYGPDKYMNDNEPPVSFSLSIGRTNDPEYMYDKVVIHESYISVLEKEDGVPYDVDIAKISDIWPYARGIYVVPTINMINMIYDQTLAAAREQMDLIKYHTDELKNARNSVTDVSDKIDDACAELSEIDKRTRWQCAISIYEIKISESNNT